MTEEKANITRDLLEEIEEINSQIEKIKYSLDNDEIINISNVTMNNYKKWCLLLNRETANDLIETLKQKLNKARKKLEEL